MASTPLYRRRLWAAWLIITACLALLTLTPFDFSTTAPALHQPPVLDLGSSDFLLNVLGFVPFAALLMALVRPRVSAPWQAVLVVVVASALVSTALELAQTCLPSRVASWADVLANTAGAFCGSLSYPWLRRLKRILPRESLLKVALPAYVVTLGAAFVWTEHAQGLQGWDPEYALAVGNELTGDRPWLGTVYAIALYDRAIKSDAVASLASMNPCEADVDAFGRPWALYTFREGQGAVVRNVAGNTTAGLNLALADPAHTEWLPGCGLTLVKSTVLRSEAGEAAEYVRLMAAGGEFTAVGWIAPGRTWQAGPARIVSLSATPWQRNFTLGQEHRNLQFRVRNGLSGDNGTRWLLETSGVTRSGRPVHVAATYDHGGMALYVDGRLAESVGSDLATVIGHALKLRLPGWWEIALVLVLLAAPLVVVWLLVAEDRTHRLLN